MQRSKRFQRFDPVTVGAATRVVRLGAVQHLPKWEVQYYLRELALMEPGATEHAHRRLWRLARRRAALGGGGVQAKAGRYRCERVEVAPACLLGDATAEFCTRLVR
jgi:hypothetical protein